MAPKQNKHDYSQLLIWSAALVTVIRYAGAFIASDLGEIQGTVSLVLSALMGLSGLGMGILDVIGGAYLFDGWRKTMPRADAKHWPFRFKILTIFVIGLYVVGIGILVPFTVSRISHQGMFEVLGSGAGAWLWSVAVNIAPYLLVGGVVTAQANVVGVAQVIQPTQPSEDVGQPNSGQSNQTNILQPTNQPNQTKKKVGRREQIEHALVDSPNATNVAIAGEFGVHENYVGRIRREMNSGNGNGAKPTDVVDREEDSPTGDGTVE